MGVVYKAEDTKLKRTVAIKFLPRQIAASGEERARFKIEAQAAAASIFSLASHQTARGWPFRLLTNRQVTRIFGYVDWRVVP
jgi:serine/threonine protein kinase